MFPIALGELVQLFRNRSVLVTMFVLPVAFSALYIYLYEAVAVFDLGAIAAILLFLVLAMGYYTTTVTTLAARRQNLFLKRLRSTAASDTRILTGLLLPVTGVAVLQLTVILTVLGVVAGAPGNALLLVVAVVTTVVMMLCLGLATAGVTNSPEHAQVTTLPVLIGTMAVSGWVGFTGTEELTLVKRVLPGGAASELVVAAWDGGVAVAESLVLLAPTVGWVVVSVALAARLFRWEPRR
ncbi:ABC transporter permease [Actinoalloteichus spitiensis]|uniref:ABC transporter permease n=1 Tax=Actinoalloteichus spitiensis TaxID=252394 RepID=UPI00035F2F28|nr:ABC transporter permease [Actinoalloteichus spitiensis]